LDILVNEQKTPFRPALWLMVCMTLDCVGLTQFSVIQIIHCNVGQACFSIYLNVHYYC